MNAAAAPRAPGDAPPAPLLAPVDLATVKDDLGIAASDSSSDAWLSRRLDGLWSRFQTYTGRPLTLSTGWVDDWGETLTSGAPRLEPPSTQPSSRASVFLRVFPVQSIWRCTVNGATVDPTLVLFEKASGKLLSINGQPVLDLGFALLSGRARIEYQAGFTVLPPVLYDALVGALGVQWSARQAQQSGAGLGGFLPTRISAIDVGEVELSHAPNVIVEATMKGVGTSDPLLGPYTNALEEFVDYRSLLGGGPMPSTELLPVVNPT